MTSGRRSDVFDISKPHYYLANGHGMCRTSFHVLSARHYLNPDTLLYN
jgi:hypothetical protein